MTALRPTQWRSFSETGAVMRSCRAPSSSERIFAREFLAVGNLFLARVRAIPSRARKHPASRRLAATMANRPVRAPTMFRAGDEFLNTQFGNNNPYNQDNEIGWLDWSQLRSNKDIFQFFKKMIAFRRNHPSLSRSRFWREDVSWYGVGPTVDLSHDSHSLAFCLHGASQDDDDIYAMINAYWEELEFNVQEGTAQEWKRIVDTALPSPDDFSDDGVPLERTKYLLAPRSIVVLCRPKKSDTRRGP
jgi:pullulanase/glycogen debranching enzyme